MGKEIELKYTPSAALDFKTLISDRAIAPFCGAVRETAMVTEYLDTEGGTAKRSGITLRRRTENGESVLYAKCSKAQSGALSERGEWSVVSDDVQNAAELLAKVGAPTEVLRGLPLTVCASVRFLRREVTVKTEALSFALSYDEGVFGRDTKFCEIELELISGEVSRLIEYGEALAEGYGLIPETHSKYARALAAERK